ncbi:UDP-N-acetylglucosamine 2-epimerase [Winogradskyella sp. PG-2]|uniref:UDP-N-acetylglucosamine 2-epimerase n=1 Tax=Winogradskyella sp. PG-2 TaxID=754409 RepID=UPI0004587CAC|nr:UDP-N-acetylglucosamine 2-epimerase [Winogradskyella sp. PG-2]BAO74399.1 UDP-N-acetylglucosamine 2-epimerase [Winogradskyella sp. PG-2]
MVNKKIVFLTGTRADFGKVKALIQSVKDHNDFEPYIFVTGMHLLHEYGYTLIEVERCGYDNISTFHNHTDEATMDLTLAKTINGFSEYIKEIQPDLIVVHGDRVEALAGSIVGSLNNILVAHIEGGELSGTIDELIRHSVSKLSHIHYTSNDEAKKRLMQMGELEQSIFTIGSPDVDIMFSDNLPDLNEVKRYYQIDYKTFGLAMFHPVTTEIDTIETKANQFVEALISSDENYVIIYPNNDLGSKHILKAYEKLQDNLRFKIFPSLRFEYFLTLLKNSKFIIGNSSAGVREAPYYSVSTINIGNRQLNRANSSKIINVPCEKSQILEALNNLSKTSNAITETFGKGNSAKLFLDSLESSKVWSINHQKQFKDAL